MTAPNLAIRSDTAIAFTLEIFMIDLRRLRYLVALSKKLNFARAAEELGITQSALTRAIQTLEQDISIRLFDRDRSGVSLTEQGRWVVARTERFLIDARDYEHQLLAASRGIEGQVRFGIAEMPAFALLRPVLAERIVQAPAFRHDVSIQDAETLFSMLISDEIEFFISAEWQLPEPQLIREEVIGKFPISIIVRNGHPLLEAGGAAGRYPILVADRNAVTTGLPLRLHEEVGSGVQVIRDFDVLAHLTRETDAIWITSSFVVSQDLARGALAELEWPAEGPTRDFRVIMYSLARRAQSEAAIAIKRAFREQTRRTASLLPSS